MKSINNYINEKLVISKKLKGYQLNDDNVDINIFYDDGDWNDFKKWVNNIDHNNDAFICFSNNNCNKNYNLEEQVDNWEVSEYLEKLLDNVITNKNQGYNIGYNSIRHFIRIDILNSGSRSYDYIYTISRETYNTLQDFLDGYEDEIPLDIKKDPHKFFLDINGIS